jgi:type VI secretion system protein ImpD
VAADGGTHRVDADGGPDTAKGLSKDPPEGEGGGLSSGPPSLNLPDKGEGTVAGGAHTDFAADIAKLLEVELPDDKDHRLTRAALYEMLALTFGPDLEAKSIGADTILASIDRLIAAIDAQLSDQVNAILHHPAFQRLEARWRGLRYLTHAAEAHERIRVRVLSISWHEVVRDLEHASDFDQSLLFDKIYTEEFGTPGGQPFGLIIGDYEMRHRSKSGHPTDDVGALKSLGAVAAAAFTPIVLGVAPDVLQLDAYRHLGRALNLRTLFAQVEYQRWLSLRDDEDIRFIGLALPRILIRSPYVPDTARTDGFRFYENVSDTSGEGYLWANAAFAFGSIVMRAFALSGWFADLRGAPRDEVRGGLVTDLPVLSFGTESPGVAIKPGIDYMPSDSLERELADLGFITLRKAPYTSYSVFYGNPSLQKPKSYDRPTADANARLACMLQYTLCVARFAHYIKMLGREKVGSTNTPEACQEFLNNWLRGYTEGSDSASQEVKARAPLREARVDVRESSRKPGAYSCTVFLRPHFQLDDVSTGFRLVTELAPQRAA